MRKIIGTEMHDLATRLFPICRSITGNGVRETLHIIHEHIPLAVHEVPTGTKVFDWTVPKEWNIRNAWITDSAENKIVDFKKNNLHIVGYSTPIDMKLPLSELQEHIHSLEKQPDAIPYVTSYYEDRWGFCMTHKQRQTLTEGIYHVYIDSEHKEGSLTYGELVIPGKSQKEIFLSTYICHPSMANNELSGPVVTTFLAQWLLEQKRKYTYRIVFVPETIGSLTYLSRNLKAMQKHILAGFNVTCIGDERAFSYLPSRAGNTLADNIVRRVLKKMHPDFKSYNYRDRGSDERQYCAPGVDLPVASIMRSKYGTYPEYHTSLDNLDVITSAGLQGGYDVLKECIEIIEDGHVYRAVHKGEPQLGKRGLFPTLSKRGSAGPSTWFLLDILAYADGTNDEQALADIVGVSLEELRPFIESLLSAGLIIEE